MHLAIMFCAVLLFSLTLISVCYSKTQFVGPSFSSTGFTSFVNGTKLVSPEFKILSDVLDKYVVRSSGKLYTVFPGRLPSIYHESLFRPYVYSITPNSAYNIAPVHIDRISGMNFSSGMIVKLVATSESDVNGENVSVTGTTSLTCDFNLVGVKAGLYDVLVSKEGHPSSRLTRGFEVKSYSFDRSLAVNYPNPFDPMRETTRVMYYLERDTDVNVYLFNIVGDMIWKSTYLSGTNGGREGENSFDWNGVSSFGEMQSNGVFLVHVVERATGKRVARGKIMVIMR